MKELIKIKNKYTPAADEPYMSEQQLDYFSRILQEWKATILADSEKTREYLKDERPQTADLNDRASQEEEFSLELRTRDRERKLLRKIDKALERIKQGHFGYCEQCDEEIGFHRLEARPTAELCIDCKHLAERKEKSFYNERNE
ncbi:RNA polymerase-binding protein DksA [Dichelobacter nodosus]|uniref:RNA polymerase-binding transcription factor DksA n=1 Tax=Dichelobacter nodosus (strain VCS1703A) TaxID=246195 RepID=A5EW31_DICNV|nr:RNA polymerase-binding protein DksA [Dichelobacter nodosus]ABQ13691.1 RNA polymerase-binding protein DksA [Dichelobacter nodosus VCS1703A]AXM45250.1 RNA polymerase-binding protein DksA [Dichelobacter nodosus]KNZ39356.1 molecular chaperone DnaK [Dichelobacter nodosus]TGA65454.1 RNA polymerase-binding protein DksA [Dichelobacter nodosus]